MCSAVAHFLAAERSAVMRRQNPRCFSLLRSLTLRSLSSFPQCSSLATSFPSARLSSLGVASESMAPPEGNEAGLERPEQQRGAADTSHAASSSARNGDSASLPIPTAAAAASDAASTETSGSGETKSTAAAGGAGGGGGGGGTTSPVALGPERKKQKLVDGEGAADSNQGSETQLDGSGSQDRSSAAAAAAAAAAAEPCVAATAAGGAAAAQHASSTGSTAIVSPLSLLLPAASPVPHAAAAWDYFRSLGSPRYHVAPMVDQSELPFRMLCRKYGAEAAYTPMLHSRLFVEDPKYRKEFTTCEADRPLFVQFCANHPDTLLAAAKLVDGHCDYVDINFGCPQRIAKRGNYGAFLMDDLPLVESLVRKLSSSSSGLKTPVSCKIRIFPDLAKTVEYAKMVEAAGCFLLAVHGRTREQKDQRTVRADWEAIRAVKQAVSIPVLANGNVRWKEDGDECMRATGADGVLSADSLLGNPALFAGYRVGEDGGEGKVEEQGRKEGGEGKGSGEAEVARGAIGGGRKVEWAMREDGVRIDTIEKEREGFLEAEPSLSGREGANGGNVVDGDEGRNGGGSQKEGMVNEISLMMEYLDLCEKYPVPFRMVRGHVHRLLGGCFRKHPDIREKLNKAHTLTVAWIKELVLELKSRMNDS